jgi:hypothetical protein
MKKLKQLVIFSVLCITTQMSLAQATQCKWVFSMPKAKVPQHIVFIDRTKETLAEIKEKLLLSYMDIQNSQTNQQINSSIHALVKLNNLALDLLEGVSHAQEIFDSGSKRILQKQLRSEVEKIFIDQKLNKETINAFLQARLQFNKTHLETTRPKNAIGFNWNESKEASSEAKKTIGFLQTETYENPYGRDNSDKREGELSQNKPMGFIANQVDSSPANHLNSIGFKQSAEITDVGFQLSMQFDFDHAIFIALSNQKPIGFTQ